ncbi:MAG TPA: branched-chain amino acid aminotransferase [Candidatus Deferrimicrobium sp.]|nr:branched-chain amino acid aminotransferase [Candidatus Deferrimicrobium sp.]
METNSYPLRIEEIAPGQLVGGIKEGEKFEFGNLFTDRMFQVKYNLETGWSDAVIKKFENFSLSPAAMVFHFAQEVFEGFKAYHRADGKIGLFRARDNLKRMNKSAERLCMPSFDVDFIVYSLKELIKLEKNWVPHTEGGSLYIRPVMIATQPLIRLRPSQEYLLYIIIFPAGQYMVNLENPAKLYVEEKYVRSIRGGTGFAKAGGNYGSSLLPAKEAHKKGFDQVLWLDGIERKYIEEVGAMNIFFVYKDKLVTPPLTDSILPGITRDSILTLARSWNMEVSEETLEINQVIDDIKTGKITESFCTGTIAVVCPVQLLHFKGRDALINQGKVGELTLKMYDHLTGIQYGKIADTFGWTEIIC